VKLPKRKDSCTFKRETSLDNQERIYLAGCRADILPANAAGAPRYISSRRVACTTASSLLRV